MLLTVRAKRQWEPTLCLRKVKQIIFCLWFISSVSGLYLLYLVYIFCLWFISSVSGLYLLSLVYIFCLWFISSVSDSYFLCIFCLRFLSSVSDSYLLSPILIFCLWFISSVSGSYLLCIFCLRFLSSVSDSYLLSPILIFCLWFISSVSGSYLLCIFCLRFLSSVSGLYLLSRLWFSSDSRFSIDSRFFSRLETATSQRKEETENQRNKMSFEKYDGESASPPHLITDVVSTIEQGTDFRLTSVDIPRFMALSPCEMEGFFKPGMLWCSDHKQINGPLRKYAFEKNFSVTFQGNCTFIKSAKCRFDQCPWRVQ